MNVRSGITLELEPVACALCSGDDPDNRTIFEGQDVEFRTCDNEFAFRECSTCGHWYLSPRPRENDLDKIYANYLTGNEDSAYNPSGLVAWIKRNVFDKRRMRVVLESLREGSNVLEIGAGSGAQLAFLGGTTPHTVTLYANELSFDARARARLDAHDIRSLEGAVERLGTDTMFDAVIGIHVIEHVVDPRSVFEWIASHLNPGGVLYFETPDTAAPARHLFKDKWGMTHFPRHFHLFSREKIAGLATECGLEIVRHGATTSAPAWNMSIRNTLGMDALTKHDSVFEMFNYKNVATLSFFTLVDLVLMTFGLPTSTQQLIARKPVAGTTIERGAS